MRNARKIKMLCDELRLVDGKTSEGRALKKSIERLVDPDHKLCTRCATVKKLVDFTPIGIKRHRCQECQKQELADYYYSHPDKMRDIGRRATKERLERMSEAERSAWRAASNAQQRGVVFDAPFNEVWKSTVPVYAKAIALRKLFPHVHWHVDHIVPVNRGGTHSVDNLQVVPQLVNQVKHNHLAEELSYLLTQRGMTLEDVYAKAGVDSELTRVFNEAVDAYHIEQLAQEAEHWLHTDPIWDGVQDREIVAQVAARIW